MNSSLTLVGVASGIAAGNPDTRLGPSQLQQSTTLQGVNWQTVLDASPLNSTLEIVADICKRLANITQALTQDQQPFCVIGGDHSCAIGTWSGVANALDGPLGLLWIDAHMDAHTFETSESGNLHGMPFAALLGHGDAALTSISNKTPAILPENSCLIGIRSYEPGEEELIKQLNVRMYTMTDIRERGLATVFEEAVAHVSQQTTQFGISLDIDALDPDDAPGTGLPVPNGIRSDDLIAALTTLQNNPQLIALEIAEFNPNLDREQMTERLIGKVLEAIYGG